ncbi:unnamed protein product, partial [Symbiodinium microadriaticum]
MLRITLLSGEDLTSIPCAELSDVQALKQRLHHQHGLPPRFRQRLLHEGNILDDAFELDSPMDLQVLTLPFSEASDTQRDRLYEASGSGPAAEVESLLHVPADPDTVDVELDMLPGSPLMSASSLGRLDVVKLLLEAKAQVDLTDGSGATALIYAAINGHAGVLQFLMESGAQLGKSDHHGWTSLMHAVVNGHAEVVQLLLGAGAEMDLSDQESIGALMTAANRGHSQVVQLLSEASSPEDDYSGRTALVLATCRRLVEERASEKKKVFATTLYSAVALVLAMSMRCPADILEPVLVIGGFVGGALGCLLPKESLLGGESAVMPCVIFGMAW